MAALFWSLHPLRVESVAWVSSRKDVLCLLFLLPGLMAYLKNLTDNKAFYLFLSGLFFLCAFMSKPTAVVYPLLAVMLEFLLTGRVTWRRNELLIWLMLVLMGVTYYVQDVGNATVSGLSILLRLENAVAGVGHYVTTTLFPHSLTVFYKYEIPVPVRRLVPGGLFLLAVFYYFLNAVLPAAKAWVVAKKRENARLKGGKDASAREGQASACPAHLVVAFGILWFGLALGPVVGLVQVGFASCADRYTYLPGIGLSIILALVLRGILETLLFAHLETVPRIKPAAVGVTCAVLAGFSVLTWRQIGTWKDTVTLFEHGIKVTRGNYVAHCNVGFDFQMKGNNEKALYHFVQCVKYMLSEMELKGIVPVHKDKNMENLAATFALLNGAKLVKGAAGPSVEKTNIFEKEIGVDEPLAALRVFALGLYAYYKELDGLAELHLKRACEMDPSDGYIWRFRGFLYERQGRVEEAVGMYEKSQALEPDKDVAKRIRRLKERGGQNAGGK